MIVLAGKRQPEHTELEKQIFAALVPGESPRSAKGISYDVTLPVTLEEITGACEKLWAGMYIAKNIEGNYSR